jgi:ubiquitin C-terminal hydrolase
MDVASHLSHLSPVLSASAEDRKRLRPSSPSSPVISPALGKTRSAGILNFGPTSLEILEEAEFSWTLPNWETAAFETPVFTIGNEPWKISYAVTQKQTHSGAFTIPSVSLYLVIADAEKRKIRDPQWGVCAEFILGISNPKPQETLDTLEALRATQSPVKPASTASLGNLFSQNRASLAAAQIPTEFACSNMSFHRFCAEEVDWGFSQFVTGDALRNGSNERGFGPLCAQDGSVVLFAKVRVLRDPTGVLWHSFNNYNGKQITGYVGLTNQGATCYMNSFLQSIFLTNAFRKAVYRIPTASCSPTDSIPLALQRVFYKLQTSRTAPSTTELTKSFGWDSAESFMQHDVQEFSRVLLEDLENKMKGSEVEGTVERIFRGKLKNVLRCTQVNYESIREESFYDLQLTIKGVPNLKESFERYVATEMLCGDNQYRTDSFGLQDAKKFVEFEHFPPVLHVHLERYAFDMMAEATVKIHDRFEYPTEIDLGPYLSQSTPDCATSQLYWLHSVLVHAGDGHGGHYFSYIRHPSSEHRWYKFDDTKVTPCTEQQAVDENFGGNDSPFTSEESNELYRSTGVKPSRYRKFTSAYLLVYIRKADLNEILTPVDETDVPAYLVERIKADDEAAARLRQERQSMHLSSNVIMVTDPVMSGHRFGDLVDLEHPACQRRFGKEDSLASICEYAVKNGYLGEESQVEAGKTG